jgi:3-oxoacyl-[acyl-carrier-protein] synthase I
MRLAVTGLGMVTAVGYGAVGSCAAIRAGIVRPRALDALWVEDGDGSSMPVTGHPVSGFAEGFFQVGAWLRLAAGSLDDLRHASMLPAPSDTGFWLRTGLSMGVPLIDKERFSWSLEERPGVLLEDFAWRLLALQGLPIERQQVRAHPRGHCGLAVALHEVRARLASRHVERVLLLGVDSYVDPVSLEWLDRGRRLKTPTRQTGFMPGEAGACVLVELESSARMRGALTDIRVEAVVCSEPPASRRPAPPLLGRSLAEVVQRLLRESASELPFRGVLVVDLNGEEWRALVWGHAQVGLVSLVDFERCELIVPGESLGEVGAASGPVGLAVAVSALLGGEEEARSAIVCSLSDSGQVGAVLLRRTGADR